MTTILLDPMQAEAVKEYQCSGCVDGPALECFKASTEKEEWQCVAHVPGTMIGSPYGISTVFLGLPKGFDKLGPLPPKDMKIHIFKTLAEGWGYNMFNVPVWKYKNAAGHTLVRGLRPRTNHPFIHIFLEDCRDKIACLELTDEDRNAMD
jgi:hypothetical protein